VVVHFLVRAVRVVDHLAPGDVVVLTLPGNQNLVARLEIDAAGVLDKISEGLISLRHLTLAALGIIAQDELVEVRTGVGFYGSIESCWNGPKIVPAPCQTGFHRPHYMRRSTYEQPFYEDDRREKSEPEGVFSSPMR